MADAENAVPSTEKLTLAIDIGGSHLKSGILNEAGEMVAGPVRVETPKPAKPAAVVEGLIGLAHQLGRFDRISIGFPGVVRGAAVLTAPNLGTKDWHGFSLADELSHHLGAPARMLNDATIQGLGVISGQGLECVLTMGTGMGFALFQHGLLTPHLEMSQHPVKTHKTYDQYVGDAALKDVGRGHWNRRVRKVIGYMDTLAMYDMLYIGGGNARLIEGPLPDRVKVVSNEAGITGGVRLWDPRLDPAFAEHPAFAPISSPVPASADSGG
ncbi:MAG TPA: ROK family protein [Acetobacteraceae bacterium]